MGLPRILRSRNINLIKWIQWFLVFCLLGFLYYSHANKLLWNRTSCQVYGDMSLESLQEIANTRGCVIESADDSRVEEAFETDNEQHNQANFKDINAETNSNETKEYQIESVVVRQKPALDLDTEVDDIVQTYLGNQKDIQDDKRVVNERSSAFYMEKPPLYSVLLKVVMNTNDSCSNAGDYDAIIAVHSAVDHFDNRAAFRWLYGDYAKTEPYRFKLVFFIGLVNNSTLQNLLVQENKEFGDTVQGNFVDAYLNMTYKAIMVFNWLDTHCHGLRALFRVDDDVFMNIHKVFYRWNYVQHERRSRTIMCYRMNNDIVLRKGKWAVPKSLIPEDNYGFMRCPGYFAAITVDLIHEMNLKAQRLPFFWIDDIVLLGLVPSAVGNVYFYPFNSSMAGPKSLDDFYECIKKMDQNVITQ